MTDAFDDGTDPRAGVDPSVEETVIASRRATDAASGEATELSSRRATESALGSADDTVLTPRTLTGDGSPGPRRAPLTNDAADEDGFGESFDEDGSTVVARRESRRRQQRAEAARDSGDERMSEDDGSTARSSRSSGGRGLPAALAADVPAPLGRVAQVPAAVPTVSPQRAGPVVVPRTAPAAREPQSYVDTAAQESARRRRSRKVVATVLVAGSLLAVGAAAALTVLVLTT